MTVWIPQFSLYCIFNEKLIDIVSKLNSGDYRRPWILYIVDIDVKNGFYSSPCDKIVKGEESQNTYCHELPRRVEVLFEGET